MLIYSFVLVLCVFGIEAVLQNVSCPVVSPRELDLKELDGKWYIIAAASDVQFQGECGSVMFSHKSDNTTDISISWMDNNVTSFYNGSVALSFDPNSNGTEGDLLVVTYTDQKKEAYSFLTLDYKHFAVVFACYDNENDNSSTYELWELSRTPQFKPKHVSRIYNVLSQYNLQETPLFNFTNTEDICKSSGGGSVHTSLFVLMSTAALAMFRILY